MGFGLAWSGLASWVGIGRKEKKKKAQKVSFYWLPEENPMQDLQVRIYRGGGSWVMLVYYTALYGGYCTVQVRAVNSV